MFYNLCSHVSFMEMYFVLYKFWNKINKLQLDAYNFTRHILTEQCEINVMLSNKFV